MTNHDKLLEAGDVPIEAIRDSQAKFSRAVDFLNSELPENASEKYLEKKNRTLFDILAYRELVRTTRSRR